MRAMTIGRGVACWLVLSLSATALYGQETKGDEPKPKDSQKRDAATEVDVGKLKAESELRRLELQKMQAELERAVAARELLRAELQNLRESLEAAAKERNSAEENLKRQAKEIADRMKLSMSRQRLGNDAKDASAASPPSSPDQPASGQEPALRDRLESAGKRLEEAAKAVAAEGMQRAADTLAQAAEQAEGAASKLDQARRGRDQARPDDIDQGWRNLLERADVMLNASRRRDEAAAKFMPKVESAVTQLRKAGRNEEADQLLAEADKLLTQRSPAPSMPRDAAKSDETPRDGAPRDHRPRDESRAWTDVERAVDGLRREVEQLRREVRDLRHSLQRGADGDESSRQESKRRHPIDERRVTSDLVSAECTLRGEVVRLGEEGRPIRVGDHVKKGDTLAALYNEKLVEMATGGNARHPDAAIIGTFFLEAPVNGTIVETNVSVGEMAYFGDVLFQIRRDRPKGEEVAQGAGRKDEG